MVVGGDRLNPRVLIRFGALSILLLGLGAAFWIVRQGESGESDVVVEPWSTLGGALWLKPDLKNARVVVPDRPHDPQETMRQRAGEGITIRRMRSFRLSTNSLRLRGPVPSLKVPGRKRVIALGESVTNGWGVSDTETYPARLQAHLESKGRSVDVINAGVPANRPEVMAKWCAVEGVALQPDLLLWSGRPLSHGPFEGHPWVEGLKVCGAALHVPVIAVLAPLSAFDVDGQRVGHRDTEALAQTLAPLGVPLVDMSPHFAKARQGRGETLVLGFKTLSVVDQESGKVWLEVPTPAEPKLPQAVLDLFEREPEVAEALMYDGGHPDAEGYDLMATVLIEPVLKALGI